MVPSPSSATALVASLLHPDPSLPERAIRSTPFATPSGQVVTSWKVAEHLYRSHTAVLPTLARGLFTTDDGQGGHRVVGRGYDKFFNVDEVAYSSWSAIEASTVGPYSLTLKSNGCLILISALDARTLLVTSKHALDQASDRDGEDGFRGGHARVGREWVQRHLARVGRTEEELAGELWERQVSAVAELCDDTFEEHVLPYPPHLTGLHLHGLSPLTPAFASLAPSAVAAFARAWGFIETRFAELATVAKVRDYVSAVEEKGEWDGERVEGFVVRCAVAPEPAASSSAAASAQAAARPPYAAGSPFFFKVKFAQPYLLYRAFREITKSLLPIVTEPARAWAGTPWAASADGTGGGGGKAGKKAFVMTDEMRAEQERKKRERDELKARKARGEVVVDSGKAKAKKDKSAAAAVAPPSDAGSTPPPAPVAAAAATPVNRDPVKVPPSQIRYPECTPYVFFVRRAMVGHPDWFGRFAQGKGIIRVRDEFLAWLETAEGKTMLDEERAKPRWKRGAVAKAGADGDVAGGGQKTDDDGGKTWGKTLIIPVAIPGCGKTAIGLALGALFGWGHEQSDDVKTKKTAAEFNRNVGRALAAHDVVYADRNNHLAQHRAELEQTALAASPSAPPRLIALNFALAPPTQPLPQHALHRLCSARIARRGDRHQTLRALEGNVRRHEEILWRFFTTAEALAADEVDAVVELDVAGSLAENLQTVLRRLGELMPGLPTPSAERVNEVLAKVEAYDPAVKKALMDAASRSDRTRYYALAPEVDLRVLARQAIDRSTAADEVKDRARAFLDKLEKDGRVTGRPHVTLVHEVEVEAERVARLELADGKDNDGRPASTDATAANDDTAAAAVVEGPVGPWKRTWDACVALANPAGGAPPPLFAFTVSHAVVSAKALALVVSSLSPLPPSPPTGNANTNALAEANPLADVPDLEHAHFTVGTANDELRPYEGRLLVMDKRRLGLLAPGAEDDDGGVLALPVEIRGQGRVVGLG